MAGRLVLVVGPSGAGKDTLIGAARVELKGDSRFVFPRRVVTRAADTMLEDHESVSASEFAAREQSGAFALSWRAHGLAYGVPAALADEVAAGRVVVVNVSRAVVGEAKHRFAQTAVIAVDAEVAVRAKRLAGRGREREEDVAERLKREVEFSDPDAIRIDNSGVLEQGVSRFTDVLRALAAP